MDPLQDPRWPELLGRHSDASIFHTGKWLETVQRTYSYNPAVFTTCGRERYTCKRPRVMPCAESWLTGRRLVSPPFSDHCEPLVTSAADLSDLVTQRLLFLDPTKWGVHAY